jgi:uncharacterized protein YkwD
MKTVLSDISTPHAQKHVARLLLSVMVGTALCATGPVHTSAAAARSQTVAGVIDTQDRAAVVSAYQAAYASPPQVTWTGNQASCVAGDTPQSLKDATLARINFFRAMAGVPADITFNATYNAHAQKAALMMAANRELDHTPPTSWKCYSTEGAQAAGKSNLSSSSGVGSIDSFMRDAGSNNGPVGHRRWILFPRTRQMGTGHAFYQTGGGSAGVLWVIDSGAVKGARPATRDAYVAWPPRGFVPNALVHGRWSFSLDGAKFSTATVTLSRNGAVLPVKLEPVKNGYGENTLVWLANDMSNGSTWPRPSADQPVDVTVSNVIVGGQVRSYSYRVTIIDASAPTPPGVGNAAPTAIALSDQTIREDAKSGDTIATLSASDPNSGDVHTYALTAGDGDTDNALFAIEGAQLLLRQPLDYERTRVLNIRVTVRDPAGATFSQPLTLEIEDVNEAPVASALVVVLSPGSLSQTITINDPEGYAIALSLVAAPAGVQVSLVENRIIVTSTDASLPANGARIIVRATDAGGATTDFVLELLIADGRVLLPLIGR